MTENRSPENAPPRLSLRQALLEERRYSRMLVFALVVTAFSGVLVAWVWPAVANWLLAIVNVQGVRHLSLDMSPSSGLSAFRLLIAVAVGLQVAVRGMSATNAAAGLGRQLVLENVALATGGIGFTVAFAMYPRLELNFDDLDVTHLVGPVVAAVLVALIAADAGVASGIDHGPSLGETRERAFEERLKGLRRSLATRLDRAYAPRTLAMALMRTLALLLILAVGWSYLIARSASITALLISLGVIAAFQLVQLTAAIAIVTAASERQRLVTASASSGFALSAVFEALLLIVPSIRGGDSVAMVVVAFLAAIGIPAISVANAVRMTRLTRGRTREAGFGGIVRLFVVEQQLRSLGVEPRAFTTSRRDD